jgi:type VI secretion system protein ImpE
MRADECLRDGNLDDTLHQLEEDVRKNPARVEYRVFLFQLLAVMGQWDRALNQLNVAGEMDAANLPMVVTYRSLLSCEALREDVFAGRRTPMVFGDPADWLALIVEALRVEAQGQYPQAQDLRAQAFDAAPATAGVIVTEATKPDGRPFAWIADADGRLGPMLEIVVDGRYYWAPVHRIRELRIESPVDLRDLVWMPAHVIWANGGQTVGMIPTRYAGSAASDNDMIRLARRTEWVEQETGVYVGVGQRMLVTDEDEYPLLDVREIHLQSESEPAAPTDE